MQAAARIGRRRSDEHLGGELSSHLLNVLPLTLAVAPLVLWRYRRAVLAGMMAAPGVTLPPPPLAERASIRAPGRWADEALDAERRLHRRVFFAVLAAAFVAGLPMSALYLYLGHLPLTPAHLFLKAGVLCSAGVPMAGVLTGTSWRQTGVRWLATLLALGAVGVGLAMVQRFFDGKAPSLDQATNLLVFLQFAALTLWLPVLLGLATGARRWRGVAPVVLSGLLVFGLAPLLGLKLTTWLTGTRVGTEWVLSGAGLETGFVVLALPVGLLAWWRLKSLARAYDAKRISDALLLSRTWWLLIVAIDVVELVSSYRQPGALLQVLSVATLTVLLLGRLLVRALRWAVAGVPRPAARTLLVLRVFGDTVRSEALFDRLVARWRWFGPVTTIAAPDVVARTVDPGDFLRFASGRIDASFVNSAADLERRLEDLDLQPDVDGRWRINEFCCRDNTWQATVARLIERADAVVMDLRGFDARRAGCAFELGELHTRSDPRRAVLLVDSSTDRALLEPLLGEGDARLALVELPCGDAKGFDAAFAALVRAAG